MRSRPTPQQTYAFGAYELDLALYELRRAGVSNSVRAERGDDIAAACGQLKTKEQARKPALARS